MQQSWVARDRISLIGWANGASALLWAVRPQSAAREAEPDFRAAIAFYPDCRISAGLGWSARVPTLLLIGANDDVSSPPACRQMVDGARGRSALTRIVVYPGAYHDFDRANTAAARAAGSTDAAAPEHGHLGTDADARAKSQKRSRGVAGAVRAVCSPDGAGLSRRSSIERRRSGPPEEQIRRTAPHRPPPCTENGRP